MGRGYLKASERAGFLALMPTHTYHLLCCPYLQWIAGVDASEQFVRYIVVKAYRKIYI